MKHWVFWLITGIVSLLGRFAVLANPLAASLTAELLAGCSFIFVGVIILFSAFNDQSWGAHFHVTFGPACLVHWFQPACTPIARPDIDNLCRCRRHDDRRYRSSGFGFQ